MLTGGPPRPAALELPAEHLILELAPPSPHAIDWHLEAVQLAAAPPSHAEPAHIVEAWTAATREPHRQRANRSGAHNSPADHMRRMTTPDRRVSS
jgi:hypothetical protein